MTSIYYIVINNKTRLYKKKYIILEILSSKTSIGIEYYYDYNINRIMSLISNNQEPIRKIT